MRRLPIYILVFVAAFCCLAGRKPGAYDLEAAARKAAALHAQSAVLEALDSTSAAYRLTDYAASLNPADSALRYDRDRLELFTLLNDSAYNALIDGLFARWRNNPRPLSEGHTYATFAYMVGDNNRAVPFLQALVDLNPGDSELLNDLCEASNRKFIRHAEGEAADTDAVLRAVQFVKDAERLIGVSTASTSQKVRSLMLLGDTAAVDTAITLLLRENPDDAFAHFYAGDIHARAGRDSLALDEVKIAYRLDPDSYDIARGLATAYDNLGDSAMYSRLVTEIINNVNFEHKERVELLADYLGNDVDESNDMQTALVEQLIENLLNEQSTARINEIKGVFLLHHDKQNEALGYFERAVAMDSTDFQALMNTVMLYTVKEDFERVNNLITRGIAVWTDDTTHTVSMPRTVFNLLAQANVNALIKLDKVTEAVEFADDIERQMKKLQINPEQIGDVLGILAAEFYANDLIDEALKFYDNGYRLNNNPMLANDYAYTLADKDIDLDKAMELINSAMVFKSDEPNVLDTYAWVLFKRGQYDEARKAIDSAMEKATQAGRTPESQTSMWTTFYEHAGDIYFMCKQPDRAVEFWQKALDLDPENDMLQRKVKHRTFFYE